MSSVVRKNGRIGWRVKLVPISKTGRGVRIEKNVLWSGEVGVYGVATSDWGNELETQ